MFIRVLFSLRREPGFLPRHPLSDEVGGDAEKQNYHDDVDFDVHTYKVAT